MKIEDTTNKDFFISLITFEEKIRNILGSVSYCSICFISTEDVWSIDAEFEFVGNGKVMVLHLQEIIEKIFCDIYIAAGEYICHQCTNYVLSTFKFIMRAKEISRELTKYLNDFYTKVVDLDNRMDPSSNYNTSKAIIVLDSSTDIPLDKGEKNKSQDKINIHNDEEKNLCRRTKETLLIGPEKFIKKKTKESKVKLKLPIIKNMVQKHKNYKCAKKKVLSSRKYINLLKEHKQVKSKKSTMPKCKLCCKTFDNFTILTEHYKVHSKLKCKICDVLVPDTEFNEHLKLNHEDETHSCHYCDMIYYTSVALVAHLKISHSKANNDDENNK